MDEVHRSALNVLAEHGGCLRDDWHFDWPERAQEVVHRLRLDATVDELPTLVAVVGGASSGKSTVFNNLLGGRLTSRITARGHATLGPILAVHDDQRALIEPLLADGLLLPGCRRVNIELDDNVTGDPDTVTVVFHPIDSLRNVLLLDTPDFTSDASSKEGDITLSLLPWFDRIIVVVDHERWFDRQSISKLRAESACFGQQRLVLFNRTREGGLGGDDRAALRQQADRLAVEEMVVLEFRRGRGFCRFPPGALEEVNPFIQSPPRDRTTALSRQVADAANHVLNQQEERHVRLGELRALLEADIERALPSVRDCMTSLMTPAERRHLEVVSRVLRIPEAKRWLTDQAQRFQRALGRVPVVGVVVPRVRGDEGEEPAEGTGRREIARVYYESMGKRRVNEVQRLVRSSAFWHELSRWTGLQPAQRTFAWSSSAKGDVEDAADVLDQALKRWVAKVEAECRGLSPHVRGALGAGAVALAVVLIAVPGPVTALTIISAKGAVGATLAHIAAAGGVGALFGKQMGRLGAIIQEKLIGSPEFDAVTAAAESVRSLLESAGRKLADEAVTEAAALVMDSDEPLRQALEVLRNPAEVAR